MVQNPPYSFPLLTLGHEHLVGYANKPGKTHCSPDLHPGLIAPARKAGCLLPPRFVVHESKPSKKVKFTQKGGLLSSGQSQVLGRKGMEMKGRAVSDIKGILKIGKGVSKPGQVVLKYADNLADPKLVGGLSSLSGVNSSVLEGLDTAKAIMAISRHQRTFAMHQKWWQNWQEYACRNNIQALNPLAIELCAFIGTQAASHGPNEALKALTVVRCHLLDANMYFKGSSWHVSCLADGLKALAACKARPKVAISFELLQDIIACYMRHRNLELFEFRNVAYLFNLFISGARPGEVVSIKWADISVKDGELEDIGPVLAHIDKLFVKAYRLEFSVWVKTDALSRVTYVVPCDSIPSIWLAHWANLQLSCADSVGMLWVFPIMSWNTKGHVSYGCIGKWWNDVRALAYDNGICSKLIRDYGTLYSLKAGFISELHNHKVPLHVAMGCSRHKSISAHFIYPIPEVPQGVEALSRVMGIYREDEVLVSEF